MKVELASGLVLGTVIGVGVTLLYGELISAPKPVSCILINPAPDKVMKLSHEKLKAGCSQVKVEYHNHSPSHTDMES